MSYNSILGLNDRDKEYMAAIGKINTIVMYAIKQIEAYSKERKK